MAPEPVRRSEGFDAFAYVSMLLFRITNRDTVGKVAWYPYKGRKDDRR
jgi:hypothetical protein